MTEAELVQFYCHRCRSVLCQADPKQLSVSMIDSNLWRKQDGAMPRRADVIEFKCQCGYQKSGLPEREQLVNAVNGVKVHI